MTKPLATKPANLLALFGLTKAPSKVVPQTVDKLVQRIAEVSARCKRSNHVGECASTLPVNGADLVLSLCPQEDTQSLAEAALRNLKSYVAQQGAKCEAADCWGLAAFCCSLRFPCMAVVPSAHCLPLPHRPRTARWLEGDCEGPLDHPQQRPHWPHHHQLLHLTLWQDLPLPRGSGGVSACLAVDACFVARLVRPDPGRASKPSAHGRFGRVRRRRRAVRQALPPLDGIVCCACRVRVLCVSAFCVVTACCRPARCEALSGGQRRLFLSVYGHTSQAKPRTRPISEGKTDWARQVWW